MFRRNTYLWSVIVIGAIVTTVGGTGIFAVFSDRAIVGNNSVDSGALASAADIQVAVASVDEDFIFDCGTFQEDLTLPLWSMSDVQPGDSESQYLCVKNVGSAAVLGSLTALDLTNSDPSCTGDEATINALCGSGIGAGQLDAALNVDATRVGCTDAILGTGGGNWLFALPSTPIELGGDPLPAGSVGCVIITVAYPSWVSETTIQGAQSDSVSWKFALDAVTVE